MRQLHLLFSNEVQLEDERKMLLNYSLTEKLEETNQSDPFYGIQISKKLDDSVEIEEVSGISYSKEAVISLIKKLFQYEVTPISMIEILDDLVTQGI